MKRALLIGIDKYDNFSSLTGCVADASGMCDLLKANYDGTANYECRLFTSPSARPITRDFLTGEWQALFQDFTGDILFYFSGHGSPTAIGGHIAVQDGNRNNPGLPMSHLLQLANQSRAREVLLILDCCFAGSLGDPANIQRDNFVSQAQLREGVTILTATRPEGLAQESQGQGVFTALVLEALGGAAADIRGYVSAAAIYAYIDQALGAWDQRPLYKSYAVRMSPIRRCKPDISDEVLRDLPSLFSEPDAPYCLNPSYEDTHQTAVAENVAVFKKFKLLRDARLLRTVNGNDLFFAAMNSESVQLSLLGQFYWRIANKRRL